jgi:hypothetical protein
MKEATMKPVFSICASVLALALAQPAQSAGDVCMPAPEMKAALIDWYGERPVAAPSADRKQLWVSQTSGTWTLVRTFSDGISCVLAQGEEWTGTLSQDALIAMLDRG